MDCKCQWNMKKLLTATMLLVVSLAGIVDACAQAQIGVACIKANGAIVIRASSCPGTETEATLSQLAIKGATGATGPTGKSGASGRGVVSSTRSGISVPFGFGVVYTEACPTGKVAISGGCLSTSREVVIGESYPVDGDTNGWRCRFIPAIGGASVTSGTLTTYAVCVDQ